MLGTNISPVAESKETLIPFCLSDSTTFDLSENALDGGTNDIQVFVNNVRQEPGSSKEIKNFCESKFGISFPMTQKEEVRGSNAHHFY